MKCRKSEAEAKEKATASRDALAEVGKELNEHSSEKHFTFL